MKIEIKKKNKGKFTEYCKGKVTNECIRKAKNSGNPKLIKRAVFAENARKWKHQTGGRINNNIMVKDVNGNWSLMDIKNKDIKQITNNGTIYNNAVKSVGGDRNTKIGRIKLAQKQASSYNARQLKIKNYSDTTIRNVQKQQSVIINKNGEPKIVQSDYIPSLQAPLQIDGPERWVIEGIALTPPILKSAKYLINKSVAEKILNTIKPTSHLQGAEAVKMFKEYGGTKIPKESINGQQLKLYVNEARERYGLVGNKDISDQEIAEALYKHIQQLGKGTGVVNSQKEPQLLFRGDTKNYTVLTDRPSPKQIVKGSETMDNSLGTLFLGEYPGTHKDMYQAIGASRYLDGQAFNPTTNKWEWRSSGTNIKTNPTHQNGYTMIPLNPSGYRRSYNGFIKDMSTEEHPNWLNAFISKSPKMRNATEEIYVLPEKISDPTKFHGTLDAKGQTSRNELAKHYEYVLQDSKQQGQGILKSNAGTQNREEHSLYNYFAVPNYAKRDLKHILPYDLRIPRDWKDPNIFRVAVPAVGVGTQKHQEGSTIGEYVNAINQTFPKVINLGKPKHNYDVAFSEKEIKALGLKRDYKGHYNDIVKKPAHPSHKSRGRFFGDNHFDLSDKGFNNVNYTIFGLNDNNDKQVKLTYKGASVLPEITVTKNGNYIFNSYDNLIFKNANGNKFPGTKAQYDNVTSIYQSLVDKGVDPQAALELTNQKVAEKGWTGFATGDNKKFNNVNSFTDHLIDWHSRMYPDSLKVNNFQDFWNGIQGGKHKYNPRGNAYKKELLLTRPGVKKRINFYRNTLGEQPLAFINNQDSPMFAKNGNKLHNNISVLDSNQGLAKYSLKLLKKKQKIGISKINKQN